MHRNLRMGDLLGRSETQEKVEVWEQTSLHKYYTHLGPARLQSMSIACPQMHLTCVGLCEGLCLCVCMHMRACVCVPVPVCTCRDHSKMSDNFPYLSLHYCFEMDLSLTWKPFIYNSLASQ